MKKQKRRRQKSTPAMRKFINSFPPYLLILALALPVFAAEQESTKGPGEKLVGGVEETATGWTDVPKEMIDTTEDSNIIEGVTVGTVKGAGEAVVDTTKGAVDVATFYIPEEKDKAEEDHKSEDEK